MEAESKITKRLIKHPSWRVYRALQDCFDIKDLSPRKYCLKEGIDVYFPYTKLDDLTASLVTALKNPDFVDKVYGVDECLRLFKDTQGRQLIETMLLSYRSVMEIKQQLRMDENSILTYKSVFFDTSVFKNDIEKRTYIKEGTAGDDNMYKTMLEQHGEAYVRERLGVASEEPPLDSMMKKGFMKSYLAMVENMDNLDDPEFQYVAQGWGNLMIKFAAQVQKKGGSGMTLDDLKVMLKTTEPPKRAIDTLNVESSDGDEEDGG